MRAICLFFALILICFINVNLIKAKEYDNNDFAEFEDFEVEGDFAEDDGRDSSEKINQDAVGDQENQQQQQQQQQQQASKADDDEEEDGIVEDDDDFEHFQDEEMFEGFEKSDVRDSMPDPKGTEPKLTVAKIPMHFRTHWDSYWMEMLMLAGLMAYFANFFHGKSKNARIAQNWFNANKAVLEENFVLVGDDGKIDNENPGLIKESESLYTLWCSGRTCCEGMLVELKMIKRQDLVSLVAGLMRQQQDQVHIKIDISPGVMDTFVFCVGTKKTVTKAFKEYNDLNKFCTLVSKPEERFRLPNGFSLLSEIPEATTIMLEFKTLLAITKYNHLVDYIHISDQFSGPIQQDDPNTLKQPETKPVLLAGFNMPKDGDMKPLAHLMAVIFYKLDQLKTYRMSREGKSKAEKNRLRVEEEFLKSTHAARAEAAALRREEKRKQEKERVMAEDDPEKQRRWELKEQKRQAKKKAPKMKRLAVKSL